jgi:UDP-glucose 4-epimerase
VVAIFIGQMLKGEQIVINGDGKQERDFVYVEDCARANLLALTAENPNTIFNLGYGYGTSINDIYSNLKKATDYKLSAINGPSKAGETQRIYLEANKARQELNWTPTVGLEDGLRKTVEYFRTIEKGS